MELYSFDNVAINGGFMKYKEELNRKITINAVYNRFYETGRIDAFECNWRTGDKNRPHFFWDSDVAKWIEGASYIIKKHPNSELETKIEHIIDLIEANQCHDGYFNSYFTSIEPMNRFKDRDKHELYCAGHLMEAAVAYAEATGRERFLDCMERYADYITKVFVTDKTAAFTTPGHEEIELALVRMYRYTGKKKFLDLASFFINERGIHSDEITEYNQSHAPVREQTEALGHSVRAMYLYCAMADLAYELNDLALKKACETLYSDVVNKKMYITGGIGSTHIGETFTKPYDLPNEEAYTETCAGIGLMLFANRMLKLNNRAEYADTIERVFYNGILAGLSLDGKSFFYENPLEITLMNHFSNMYGTKRYPITQRVECFECSCCPPNLNRLLPTLGGYIYGHDGDTLYINQFADSTLNSGTVHCRMQTAYPRDGKIQISSRGTQRLAVRIPSWCNSFEINKPYTSKDGYAIVENDGETILTLDMTPFAVSANVNVIKDTGKLCIQSGPIVYCAEAIDNGENLHAISLSPAFGYTSAFDSASGLNTLEIDAFRSESTSDKLYTRAADNSIRYTPIKLKLIPYYSFANRGETDMLTWFNKK